MKKILNAKTLVVVLAAFAAGVFIYPPVAEKYPAIAVHRLAPYKALGQASPEPPEDPELRAKLAKQPPHKPFTLNTIEYHRLPGKEPVESMRIFTARNTAGDMRSELVQTIGARLWYLRIRRVNGLDYQGYPDLKAIRTFKHEANALVQWRGNLMEPSQQCAKPLSGQSADMKPTITREKIGDLDTFRLEFPSETVWRAPDLSCSDVQRVSRYSDNNTTSELRLASYTIGEPSPELFESPAVLGTKKGEQWQELKPTALETLKLDRKFPWIDSAHRQKQLSLFASHDAYYDKHRP